MDGRLTIALQRYAEHRAVKITGLQLYCCSTSKPVTKTGNTHRTTLQITVCREQFSNDGDVRVSY